MPSASDINAGGAVVTIGGDASSLNSVLVQAQSKLQAFGSAVGNIGLGLGAGAAAIGALGAAIVAPFAAGLAALQDVAPNIARAARITGLSFEQVQDIAAGARISFEDMPGVIQKMSAAIVDARNPTSQMARDFAELGLNIDALNGQDAQGQLAMIADALSNVTDEARRMDLARNILGRSGAGINLSGGAAGINARAERNREIGGFLSNNDIRAGLDFARAQNELKIASVGLSRVLGAVLAPVMTWIAETTLTVVMAVRGWVDRNRALLAIVARFGVFLGFLATILGSVAASFVTVSGIITFLGPALAMAGTALAAIGQFALYAIGPIGVLVGLFFAAQGILASFGTSVSEVWSAIMEFVGGIIDAIDWIDVLTYATIGVGAAIFAVIAPAIPLITALALQIYAVYYAIRMVIDNWDIIAAFFVDLWRRAMIIVGYVVDVFRSLARVFEPVLLFWNYAFGWIVDSFRAMFGEIRNIVSAGVETVQAMIGDIAVGFGGIGDAINAGDWAAAFEIGLITIQLLWERAKNFILDTWYRIVFVIGSTWDALVVGLGTPLASMLTSIIRMFYSFIGGLETAINRVIEEVNYAISLLPARMRPASLATLNLAGNADAAVAAVNNALVGPPRERVQQQADRTRQEELQAQQAALADRARFDAENQAIWDAMTTGGGGAARGDNLQFGSSLGSFSAAALSQVGGGNYAERTAVAVEAMVPGINRVGDLLENDEGGVFQ